jgi:hypothetical protein
MLAVTVFAYGRLTIVFSKREMATLNVPKVFQPIKGWKAG